MRTQFIKVNEVALSQINVHGTYVNRLLPQVCSYTGRIVYDNNKYIKGPVGMGRIMGINRNYASKILKQLISEDVIHKKDGYYVFNPFIALRGTKCTLELYEEFSTSKWRFVNTTE